MKGKLNFDTHLKHLRIVNVPIMDNEMKNVDKT